jgi:hypothetical protein
MPGQLVHLDTPEVVAVQEPIVLASDRDSGLWIFRYSRN